MAGSDVTRAGDEGMAAHEPPKERSRFRSLVMGNPNYFGNLVGAPFEPVLKLVGDTTYEQLTCIGFNPNLDLLEGTVAIKSSSGYGGGLCHAGSREYVRFFVDYGSGWEDAGVGSFSAHDLPYATDCAGDPERPLTYVVSLPIEPRRDYCGRPVLPKVRGILSWEVVPPGGDPDWTPVWGNVVEQSIQVKPRRWLWSDIFSFTGIDLEKAKFPGVFKEVDPEPIPLPDPEPLQLADVAQRYAKLPERALRVEPHRFALPHMKMAVPGAPIEHDAVFQLAAKLGELDIDWGDVVDAFDATTADVSYEQVECVGLDENLERLVATFRIKRPYGYSGELCEAGSKEYVAFWADWEDECEWTYLGTVAVDVHDFPSIPDDGLAYSAVLPVDLRPFRRPCKEPRVGRVRAVLSWAVPPSTTDADDLTTWGNRLDAHVQIPPGEVDEPGGPRISVLGGIGVADIDVTATGLTRPGARFAFSGADADPWDSSRQCPFGGLIIVQGPSLGSGRYRVRVRSTTTWSETFVTAPIFTVNANTGVGTWRYPDGDDCFSYLPPDHNINDVLGHWRPSGDDLWEVRVETVQPAPGNAILAASAWHRIQLDNTRPERRPPLGTLEPPTVDITIDAGGACKDFVAGTTIQGHFVARDSYFGAYSLSVLPSSMLPNAPSPSTGSTQTLPDPGNPWTLDTDGMDPCGYVAVVQVWDRAIVNSLPGHHNYNYSDVGFCLRST